MERTWQSALAAASLVVEMAFGSACWTMPRHASASEVTGTYVVQHNFGTEELEIRSDGTYTQRLKEESGRVTTNDGHWQLHPGIRIRFQAGSELRLGGAIAFSDPFGRLSKDLTPHDWDLMVGTVWGRRVLEFNPDLRPFEKMR